MDRISERSIDRFVRDGFFVVRRLYDSQEVALLLSECRSILAGDYGRLYESAIQYLEGPPAEDRVAVKIMSALERSVALQRFYLQEKLLSILRRLLGPDILLLRDIFLLKPARVGPEVRWHRDTSDWPIQARQMVTVWSALEGATVRNGCLRVIPQSHREPLEPDETRALDLPARPGDTIFLDSHLLHSSPPNRSRRSRYALIASFMPAEARLIRAGTRSRFRLVSGRTHPGCIQAPVGMEVLETPP